jgi:hypothetical protein
MIFYNYKNVKFTIGCESILGSKVETYEQMPGCDICLLRINDFRN